ncbi:hypothetical protein ACIPUD_31205 [Bradyrhizobium sp. CAR08]
MRRLIFAVCAFQSVAGGCTRRRVVKITGIALTGCRHPGVPPVVRKAQPLIEKVWRHCEDKGSRGRTVKLRGRFNDLEIITRSRTGRVPISSRCELETCRSSSFKRDTRSKADPPSCLHARANRRPSCSSAYQFESASIRIKTAVHQ